MAGLLAALRSPRLEEWLIQLVTAVAVLTAGPDPMPLSGAWS